MHLPKEDLSVLSCVLKGETTFHVRQHVHLRFQSKILCTDDHIYKLFFTDTGETNGAEPHRPHLASQSSVESTVPSSSPSLLGIFCFVILLLVSTLLIVAVFIRVMESYM